jgi:LCP family protein required for cell wall assembly
MRQQIFRSRVIALVFVGVLAFAGIVFASRLSQTWDEPLGPGLELPTWTPIPSPTSLPATPTLVVVSVKDTPAPTLTATIQSTPTPEPLCGGPQVMYLLGVGADSRADDYLYGLADVVRIARVDFTIPKVTMLSLPRDLWVEIPDIEDHYGITHGKLNQAYLFGGPGMGYYDGPGGGPGLLARTLDLNFGLRVDHYGAVNMQTFIKIVDALGGIDIFLKQPVDGRPIDDKTDDMGYFPAGQHHLNGLQALKLSRVRKKYNDLTRADNQTLVMCALKEKITSPAVLPKIPKIISAFQGSVLTDLSLAQISQLACLAPHLERENLVFTGLPPEILKPSRIFDPHLKHETFVYDTDFDVIRDLVSQFIDGSWPTEPDEPSCP